MYENRDARAGAPTEWMPTAKLKNTNAPAAPVPGSLGTMAGTVKAARALRMAGTAYFGEGMTMHHDLKIRKCYFDPGLAGEKPFEIRRNNDRGFQKGDTVRFIEIDDIGVATRREFRAEITYVTGFEQREDYVVFGYRLER